MANSGWSWYLFAVPAIHIGRMRSTAVVVNYRGGEAQQFLQHAVRRVKASINKAQALVVPSGYLRQVFQQFGMAVVVVPNIVDLDRFRYRQRKAIPDNATDTIELFFPRHLEYIYGADLAIEAVAQLKSKYPGLKLKLAGAGPEHNKLKQMTEDLQVADRVEFLGSMSPDQMVEAYQSAHIVINPSRVDNMPNALIESLACGTPVVACRVGGVPFMANHGEQALLVTAEKVDELKEAIDTLIRQPDLYESLRQQGRQHVEQWGWQTVRAMWLEVYQQALTENR
ncbi:MAG TPA: glycosyl transferase family 1 [Gammaproteobacteria bacterium]|nr:glycosyl transferase family 1 [Gammaproteobacteria bacterium]